MKTFFLIHGSYGSPENNWFPWLKDELENAGHKVYVPRFPTPNGQSLDKWMNIFLEFDKYIDDDTIFIGHSLGSAFIFSILEKYKAKAAFLVSGFIGLLGLKEFDPINQTISDKDFDWEIIKENCKNFFIFHSENDPYVPLSKGNEIAGLVGGDFMLVENAGHFNETAGYKRFDLLLEKIKLYVD